MRQMRMFASKACKSCALMRWGWVGSGKWFLLRLSWGERSRYVLFVLILCEKRRKRELFSKCAMFIVKYFLFFRIIKWEVLCSAVCVLDTIVTVIYCFLISLYAVIRYNEVDCAVQFNLLLLLILGVLSTLLPAKLKGSLETWLNN